MWKDEPWETSCVKHQILKNEDYFHIFKNVLIKEQTWGHWCCLPKRTGEFLLMPHFFLRQDQFWDSDPISLWDHQSKNLPWIAITWLRLPLELHCMHYDSLSSKMSSKRCIGLQCLYFLFSVFCIVLWLLFLSLPKKNHYLISYLEITLIFLLI